MEPPGSLVGIFMAIKISNQMEPTGNFAKKFNNDMNLFSDQR